MKIVEVLNKAFCGQYKREVGVDLKLRDGKIMLNNKKQELTSKLKEQLREQLYDAVKDNLFLKNVVSH